MFTMWVSMLCVTLGMEKAKMNKIRAIKENELNLYISPWTDFKT